MRKTFLIMLLFGLFTMPLKSASAKNFELKEYKHKIIGILGAKPTKNWVVANPDYDRFKNYVFTLFKEPNKNADPHFRLTYNQLQTADYYHSRTGIMAYGFKELDWYRVFHKDQFYWLKLPSDMTFYPYADLLVERKAYIKHWDWKVFSRPGETKTYNINKEDVKALYGSNPAIEVVKSKLVGKQLWMRVRVMDSNCYEEDRPGITLASGWLPAYTPDNRTTFWFNSRDCGKEGY